MFSTEYTQAKQTLLNDMQTRSEECESPCVTSKFSIKREMSKIWRHYGYFAAWGSHEKRANIKPAPFREQAI